MSNGTFYDVLQLRPGAAADDVRKAYRRLAKENHPDAGAPDSGQMALINQAYDVLSSPERRAEYDTGLSRPAGGGRQPGRVELPGERRKRRAMLAGAAVVLAVVAGSTAWWMLDAEPEQDTTPIAVKAPAPAAAAIAPADSGLRLTATHRLAKVPTAQPASRAP